MASQFRTRNTGSHWLQKWQKNNFKKLTQGLFDSDEDEGWDFTSISSNLLNGIGAYRPQAERHFILLSGLLLRHYLGRYMEVMSHPIRHIWCLGLLI